MTNVKDGLNGLLADATVLYQKLRTFHWDVAGPHFFELHEKFEEQYQRFAQIVDDIAERILTIEGKPLGTLAALLEAAEIKEATKVPNARDMVASLEADYGTILRAAASSSARRSQPATAGQSTCSMKSATTSRRRAGCCGRTSRARPRRCRRPSNGHCRDGANRHTLC